MANIISLNISERTVGGSSFLSNLPFGRKNSTVFSPNVIRGFDSNDFVLPIRNDGTNSYFTTKEKPLYIMGGSDNNHDFQIQWKSSDNLATIASKSNDFVLLTVVKKLEFIATKNDAIDGVNMGNEAMVFNVNKMKTGGALVPRPSPAVGTIFQYHEEGNPNPVQYVVNETIAMIAAAIGPVSAFDGYELYVNNRYGNNATAQFGDSLRPWLTFDGAFAAALARGGVANIIVTGGTYTSAANFFADGINVEIKSDSILIAGVYQASNKGNQIICGKGELRVTGANGVYAVSSFTGNVNISVGTFTANGTRGALNESASTGAIHVNCDYSVMGAACAYLYAVTGSTNIGSFKTNILHTDNSTGANKVTTFYINPTAFGGSGKAFSFYIAEGVSGSVNQGTLCLANLDGTYVINAELNIDYSAASGTKGLSAILACVNCTGGILNLRGQQDVSAGASQVIILNSQVSVYDYTNLSQPSIVPSVIIAGGTAAYTMYGKKLTFSNAEAISLGKTFTSPNATIDLATPSGTAGTDTFYLKGGLKCLYMNNAAIGVLVANGNPNFVFDAGTIQMLNSNTTNDAIHGVGAQNFKVFGTGFTRGAVNVNMTNTIAGTAVVTDAGITVNI